MNQFNKDGEGVDKQADILQQKSNKSCRRSGSSSMNILKSKSEPCSHFTQIIEQSDDIMQGRSNSQKVLIIYASGSMGADSNMEIQKGYLKEQMRNNLYLCDIEQTLKEHPKAEALISPKLNHSIRLVYTIHELEKIEASITINIAFLGTIASIIEHNYNFYNSFIILCGLDTICELGSALSFMLENLGKLVICTGGYFPLSRMKNDSALNLVESFAVVSEAQGLNDVIIVNKNRGFRANRCIKKSEGDFDSFQSPCLPPIVSVKTKLTVRSFLFQQRPTQRFSVFYDLSDRIKILKLSFYQSLESIEYDLSNPNIQGIVIESYSFANLPNKEELLLLFKRAHEQRGIIFINISQPFNAHNESLMSSYLEKYHIYFGADMTSQGAMAKLSYLLGKKYEKSEILKMIPISMRGELTEKKEKMQFTADQTGILELVDEVIDQQFPTNLKHKVMLNIEKRIIKHITREHITPHQFEQMFARKVETNDNLQRGVKSEEMQRYIQDCKILHLSVENGNLPMAHYVLDKLDLPNQLDQHSCSPMFYALLNMDKQLLHLLKKHGGKVICPIESLFDLFIENLKEDRVEFFNLLWHIEFRDTLSDIVNVEKRNVAHLAGLYCAEQCYTMIKNKFFVSTKAKDIYDNSAEKYMESSRLEADSKRFEAPEFYQLEALFANRIQ